jgi:hypothetical protein
MAVCEVNLTHKICEMDALPSPWTGGCYIHCLK